MLFFSDTIAMSFLCVAVDVFTGSLCVKQPGLVYWERLHGYVILHLGGVTRQK